MRKTPTILTVLNKYQKFIDLLSVLDNKKGAASVFGLTDAHKTHFMAGLYELSKSSLLIVMPDDVTCMKAEEELSAYGIEAMHFPAKTQVFGKGTLSVSGGTSTKRIETLVKLMHGEKCVVLVTSECLMQKIAPKDALSVLTVNTGEETDMTDFAKTLQRLGYERREMCDESCTFSVRGGRIDVFPSNCAYPVRIEFFGDEIDTMRSFDPEMQRSIENIDSVTIYPATETPVSSEQFDMLLSKLKRGKDTKQIAEELSQGEGLYRLPQMLSLIYDETAYIWDYMPENTIIAFDEPLRLSEAADTEYNVFCDNVKNAIEEDKGNKYLWSVMSSTQEIMNEVPKEKLVMFSHFTVSFPYIAPKFIVTPEVAPVIEYNKEQSAFYRDLRGYLDSGYAVLVYGGRGAENIANGLKEEEFPVALLPDIEKTEQINKGTVTVVSKSLPKGFDYRDINLVVITENELYGLSMHRKQAYTSVAKRKMDSGADRLLLSKLTPGDYVVHDVHGIGVYEGIQEIEVDGVKRDYIYIRYANTDKLYVPCDQLERLQKYIGNGEKPPKISRLDSGEWKRTVARVKASVKDLAFNLMALYGERMQKKGFAFSPDTPDQLLMEAAFPYDETPDQLTSIAEIKRDMESPMIMDRLLCGDVGFGKTEVAMRAAFKAVMDCKQVAFLVPTTILAYQHYNTVKARFAPFGVRVDFLSRFKSKQELKESIRKLKEGETDVIIGTHRLLSKDVKFEDLGLLIIDEEQRFGVGHKELIKELKKDIDVLTLTATPIPRTMHMSLVGIRDISILDTPPKQRYPVQTFVTEYQPKVIRDAILKETGRGGQVFFLYNNVQNMDLFFEELKELVPEIRMSYAHGQMPEEMLENTMLDFIDGKFDLLLSSTIIENGLDVPNANTLIVYDADKLGLSQMYQLRGRVGRSKRIGFAYFTFREGKVLSEVAEKRLTSISRFTELGSGYKIAMQDLQIRGAGDLLGPQQHGHMEEIGYELYRRLVSEAVLEARGKKPHEKVHETTMEVSIDAYIPKTYIQNEEWRLSMYKRISHVETQEDILDVQDELLDRFGDIPQSVINLMNIALVKATASTCYIKRLTMFDDEIIFVFTEDAPYDIEKLLEFIGKYKVRLTDANGVVVMHIMDKNKNKGKVLAGLYGMLSELKQNLEKE